MKLPSVPSFKACVHMVLPVGFFSLILFFNVKKKIHLPDGLSYEYSLKC